MNLPTVPVKTIVNKTKNASWFGTDYIMNIYRGCCHGCIYCNSRSECYHIDEFDQVKVKERALEIIRDDLRRKVKTGVVGTGSMSDPYNPFEKDLQLTRHALELLDAYGFGAAIATKSTLITRDIDILHSITDRSPVLCKITITTCDDELSRRIEPGAPCSSARFEAVRRLSQAGIYTGILLMPVLPFLEDTTENITRLVYKAAENGARFVYPAFGVTLRMNQRDWFYEKLEEQFPGQGLAQRYRQRFGNAYTCTSPHASALWKVFTAACRETGLLYSMQEITRAYKTGYDKEQLTFFNI